MYKLAETFIKKESQWQPAVAALPPLAVGLGATSMAIGAGLTYNTLKNNPTDFKKWQTIPSATAAATGVAVKNVYDWGKDAVNSIGNSIGNFVAPKKPTISNTLPNQPGLLSNPKPLDWTNTAPSDVTSVNMYKKKNNSDAQVEQKISRASQGGTEPMPQTNPSKEPGKEPGRWDKFKNFANNHKWSFKYPLGLGVGTAATVLGYGGAHMFYDFANSDRTKQLDENMKVNYDKAFQFDKNLRDQKFLDSLKKQNETLKDSIKKFPKPGL